MAPEGENPSRPSSRPKASKDAEKDFVHDANNIQGKRLLAWYICPMPSVYIAAYSVELTQQKLRDLEVE
jgi:hypothetical protein